jgi:hypothetical protein
MNNQASSLQLFLFSRVDIERHYEQRVKAENERDKIVRNSFSHSICAIRLSHNLVLIEATTNRNPQEDPGRQAVVFDVKRRGKKHVLPDAQPRQRLEKVRESMSTVFRIDWSELRVLGCLKGFRTTRSTRQAR